MISHQDQNALFTLIAKRINYNIVCYAFGGNAMMYYGYKDETKDVDLLFEHADQRTAFIETLKALGYDDASLLHIYTPDKLKDPYKPIVLTKEDGRFDLFLARIFSTFLSPIMKEHVFAVHEFRGKHTLTVNVLSKEVIVLLKSVTSRERDFDDIVTIMQNEKQFNWRSLLDEVRWQVEHGNEWVVIDVGKMMEELTEYIFVPEAYFAELRGMVGGSTEKD